jgi:hypothetical protein
MRKWKFHCLGEVGADCWKAGLPHWHAGVLARGNSDRKTLDHRLASELCQPYKPIALFVTDSALLHIYVHMRAKMAISSAAEPPYYSIAREYVACCG